jgi:hypothetical protein
MILHVVAARRCGPFLIDVRFNDGVRKRLNLRPTLTGPVFRPLRDPKFFARWKFDRIMGVIYWPNGADFAPEYLHGLPDARAPRRSRRPPAARAAARR